MEYIRTYLSFLYVTSQLLKKVPMEQQSRISLGGTISEFFTIRFICNGHGLHNCYKKDNGITFQNTFSCGDID